MQLQHITSPIPSLEEIAIKMNGPIAEGPEDLIPGFMPKKGQVVIAGQTNVGKTLSSLEVISSLITGTPLWGQLQPTMKINKVLYILGEHYPEVLQRLLLKTKLPVNDQVFLIGPEQLGYDKWLVAKGQPNLQSIDKFKKWSEGCDLIVFDPLSAFCIGIDVEQDNVTMRLVLDSMSLIAQSAGASCMVLAHQGKPMMDHQGKEHSRKSYAIRGASGIEDAATNIWYMDHSEASDPSQRAADGRIYEMRQRKYKGNAPDSYRLLRDPDTLTHTLLGNKPYSDVLKIAAQAKVSRLQAAFDGKYNYRTCIKIAAAVDGIPEETMRRHLGVA